MPTGAESGLVKTVVGALLKPFEIVITPISERIASRLKRKPRLHVQFHPLTAVWCLAHEKVDPAMQVVFTADFAHDDPRGALFIVNAYPLKAQSWYPFEKFNLNPGQVRQNRITLLAQPVIGEKGRDWTGRIVFVDQFGRKYKTPKNRFKWVGPAQ